VIRFILLIAANLIKNETTKPIVNTPPTTNTSQNMPNIDSTTSLPRRIAVSVDTESSNENNNSLTPVKTTNRSVITNSPNSDKEEPTAAAAAPQPRLVVNRTVIQSSSNRIVVASTNTNSLIKEKVNEQIRLKRNHSPSVSSKKQKVTYKNSNLNLQCSPSLF